MQLIRILFVSVIVAVNFWHSAGQAPDLVDRARSLYPPLQAAGEPSVTPLPAADTTALGCELLRGLPLPDPLDVYRLEFSVAGAAFAVHISADGSLMQACDERLPNLGAGTQWVARADADSDGDGMPGSADDCPYIAGGPAATGCPLISATDRDGDGIPDSADRCEEQAGAALAEGCALLADADGDGLPDHIDICPFDVGLYQIDFASGCPADGSGSSAQRRSETDVCAITNADVPLRASGDQASPVIGGLTAADDRSVIGRSAGGDWLQLAAGWVSIEGAQLTGACYNIPLVSAEAGGATGCFLRPLDDYANVRETPAAAIVTRLEDGGRPHALLGSNFAGDWLMIRAGWVSRAVVELAGHCDNLPVLDPALVGSGVIHFCPPGFRGFLPPRIGVGIGKARVVSDTLSNRLRARPGIDARQIGEIAPRQTIAAVLDGPACNGPWVWWQVEVDGLVGWTVESDVNYNYYYLEPIPGAPPATESRGSPAARPMPASGRLIHSGNVDAVNLVGMLPVAAPRALAWSSRQRLLAVAGGGGAVRVFSAADFSPTAVTLIPPAGAGESNALSFSPDERWLALGDLSGNVRLLDLQEASAEARQMGRLAGPIQALAWSRAGDKLAAVSGADALRLARRAGTLQVWTIDESSVEDSRLQMRQHFPYPLTAVAFSADDRWLAVSGESSRAGRAALWIFAAAGELQLAKPLIPLREHSSVLASPAGSLSDFVYSSGDSLYQLDVISGIAKRFYHQAGALLKDFAFRPQVLSGAEALMALSIEMPGGAARLQLTNALSPFSKAITLDMTSSALAFSPDGRSLALAEPERDRVLILGVTES